MLLVCAIIIDMILFRVEKLGHLVTITLMQSTYALSILQLWVSVVALHNVVHGCYATFHTKSCTV